MLSLYTKLLPTFTVIRKTNNLFRLDLMFFKNFESAPIYYIRIEEWKKEQEQPSSANGSSMESSTASGSTLRSIVSAPPPLFSYVTAKSHRLVFLLDRSSSMNHNVKIDNFLKKLAYHRLSWLIMAYQKLYP